MKQLIYLILPFTLLVATNVQATEVCTATDFGWEAYCATIPSKISCNFNHHCRWASSGSGTCNAKEVGWEAYCAAQPAQTPCEFQDKCFWAK